MKVQIRTLACATALLATVFAIAGCGGRQTMASKSAAAYDEAKKNGIPIQTGEHGGHEAQSDTPATDQTSMPGMDHSAMAGMDHSKMAGMQDGTTPGAMPKMPGMDHSKMPGMKHGTASGGMQNMPGMGHSAMAGMDQSKMAGMQQHGTPPGAMPNMPEMDHSKMPEMKHDSSPAGAHDMAGMDHSAMAGMDHSSMPGMAHGSMTGMSGLQHGSSTAAPLVIPPPTSNAAIAQTQRAATLRADEFDAPAPAAIEEAAKGASGMSHSMENATPKSPVPPKHDHSTPQPPSEHHHHAGGEAS